MPLAHVPLQVVVVCAVQAALGAGVRVRVAAGGAVRAEGRLRAELGAACRAAGFSRLVEKGFLY